MLNDTLSLLTKSLLEFENKQEGDLIGQSLFDVLNKALNLDANQKDVIATASQGALSAYDSAHCISYPVRNQAILKATIKAIESFDNPKILYIGPGPLTPFFIFPLLLGYKAQFTLLEINPYAIQVMTNLIEKLGFEEYVLQTIEADAINWKVDQSYDIILCETTDVGLRREDTLPIYKNLKQQLPNAIFIPKDVIVLAGSKKLNILEPFDSLNEAIERGHLRSDFPFTAEEELFVQNKVIMDDDITVEPGTSVITTPLYIREI